MDVNADRALLIDGHNMLFRAFSSVPRSITSPEGVPVNGVYGLMGTLLRLVRDHAPRYVAVAFDVPEVPTFRHKLYSGYQGQRGPLGGVDAENFAWQIDRAREVLDLVGILSIVFPGFEADDILGTLSNMASENGIPSLIVSSDRDLQQLVRPLIHVLIPGKKPLEIGPEEVRNRLGIRPESIVDWKVLAGDPSDNIPGVRGVGDRSAVELVAQFGTWQSVYENLDSIPQRQKSALLSGRSDAELFDQVVRIHCNLDLDVALGALDISGLTLPERAGDALRLAGLRPPE